MRILKGLSVAIIMFNFFIVSVYSKTYKIEKHVINTIVYNRQEYLSLDDFRKIIRATVKFEKENKILSIKTSKHSLLMQIGDRGVWFDEEFYILTAPALMRKGKILLPFRDIKEKFKIKLKKVDTSKDIVKKKLRIAKKKIKKPGASAGAGNADTYIDSRFIYPWLEHVYIETLMKHGPVRINMLRVDFNYKDVAVKAALAQDSIIGCETVSSMVKRYGAIAGINGTFFAKDGDPLGMIIMNGKVVSTPVFRRSVFGITYDGKVKFGNPGYFGKIVFSNGTVYDVDGLNKYTNSEGVFLFTTEYAERTGTIDTGDRIEISVVRGRVIGKSKANSIIPPDGYVISVKGTIHQEFESLELWDRIELSLYPDTDWNDVVFAVQGGPCLVKEGKIKITAKEERFRKDITQGRAPRTAIGFTRANELILLVVDGRQKTSAGMTLFELAEFMKNAGCIDAINLDGGGSSTMVVEGEIVNTPSDLRERKVSNAILILKKKKELARLDSFNPALN